VFTLFSGQLFRAALSLWVAAASEPSLRDQIVPLEARIGREIHKLVVEMLAGLALVHGEHLDDSKRRARIAAQWTRLLDSAIRPA